MGSEEEPPFLVSLVSGGIAGISVDIALFPLDTLKTRLQSPWGFLQSGGFKHLYKGLGPAAVGSAPSAALFFSTYNTCKKTLKPFVPEQYHPLLHMFSASMAELASCIVKVPTEILKQRQQACVKNLTTYHVCRSAYANEGFFGFYRGFSSTVLREIPFSIIQLPIWEVLKKHLRAVKQRDLNPLEVSLCGAIAGGISAAATTPLDVAKTRIMLSELDPTKVDDCKKLHISTMLGTIYREGGVRGLFAGFVPRTVWITIGGAVFFGIYEASRELLVKF